MSIKVINMEEKKALMEYLDHVYTDIASIKELYDMNKEDLDYLDKVKADVDKIVDMIDIDDNSSDVIGVIKSFVELGYFDKEIVERLGGTVGIWTVERVRKMRCK